MTCCDKNLITDEQSLPVNRMANMWLPWCQRVASESSRTSVYRSGFKRMSCFWWPCSECALFASPSCVQVCVSVESIEDISSLCIWGPGKPILVSKPHLVSIQLFMLVNWMHEDSRRWNFICTQRYLTESGLWGLCVTGTPNQIKRIQESSGVRTGLVSLGRLGKWRAVTAHCVWWSGDDGLQIL